VQGKVDLREPIYSTQYSVQPLPADWLAAWQAAAEPELHLPTPNPFIPTDFTLLQVWFHKTLHPSDTPRNLCLGSIQSHIRFCPFMDHPASKIGQAKFHSIEKDFYLLLHNLGVHWSWVKSGSAVTV